MIPDNSLAFYSLIYYVIDNEDVWGEERNVLPDLSNPLQKSEKIDFVTVYTDGDENTDTFATMQRFEITDKNQHHGGHQHDDSDKGAFEHGFVSFGAE